MQCYPITDGPLSHPVPHNRKTNDMIFCWISNMLKTGPKITSRKSLIAVPF
uniref:Uncharacterized protein n=1 Tax=Anguilla anguilla TaxID=7936 RepID=A0A0E9X5U9_ANGAN